MKMIRSISTSLLAVGLMLCLLAGAVTPVHAAESDMASYLAKALGVTQSELNSYAANYKASLPIDYTKKSDSFYAALGGGTAYGHGSDSFETCYADLIADKYGFGDNYEPAGSEKGLTAVDAVGYINGDNDRKKVVPNAIKEADFITFQLDGNSLMAATKATAESVLTAGGTLNWEKYITDSATLAEIENFRTNMTNEYTEAFGASNAKNIAMVLECMLYECVVYGHETMNAVSAIRKLNGNAVVLVLGLYNPLRNLTLTTTDAGGSTTIKIGAMVDEMIKVCNTYLLKQTKNLKNTAFIDVSNTNTNGFGNINLDMNDPNAVAGKLLPILTDESNQYANQKGHDYIAAQVTANAKAPCKHSYTAWSETKAPTCTEKGEETRSCKNCSITETREVKAAGHAWDKGTVITEPTCTTKGEKTLTCKTCKATKNEAIDTIEHPWDEGVVVTEPTCETKGKKTLTCTVCKKTSTQNINATGHDWDNGVVTTEPSCMTEGVKTTTCATCGKTTTEAIPTVDHTWDEGVITTQPGCETEGEKTTTCIICGQTTTETVPATDHTWDEGTVTEEAGCETVGHKTTTCTGCGETTTETIPATGHHFGEYTSNDDATCQKDGTKTATCAGCDAKDTVADEGSKTDHIYKDGVCTFCNAAEATETEPEEKPNNTVVWVVVGVSSAVVLAGGGAAGFWFFKRKRIV